MRLVFLEKARAKPVDRMQKWIPGQDITDPIRHHPRHVEDSRTEIQYAGQLRPDLVPGFGECSDDGIDKTAPATKQPDDQDRSRQARKIVRQNAEPDSAETREQDDRYECVGKQLEQTSRYKHIEGAD